MWTPPLAVSLLCYALLLAMFVATFLFLKRRGDAQLAQQQDLAASDLLDAAWACDGYEQLARTLQLTQHLRALALRQKSIQLVTETRLHREPRLEIVSGLAQERLDIVHQYAPPKSLTSSTTSNTTTMM